LVKNGKALRNNLFVGVKTKLKIDFMGGFFHWRLENLKTVTEL
jgi:hypothetical protein